MASTNPSDVNQIEQPLAQAAHDARNESTRLPQNVEYVRPQSGRYRAPFHAFRHQNPEGRYRAPNFHYPPQHHYMHRGGAAARSAQESYWQYNHGYVQWQEQQFYPANNYYFSSNRPYNRYHGPRPHQQYRNETRTARLQPRFKNQNIEAATRSIEVPLQPTSTSQQAGAEVPVKLDGGEVAQSTEFKTEEFGCSVAAVPNSSAEISAKVAPRVTAVAPPNRMTLAFDAATETELNELCGIERAQLKRRFRLADTLFIDHDGSNSDSKSSEQKVGREIYTVIVAASDPDWPFDVKSVTLIVDFPVNYPREPMHISVAEKQRSVASRSKGTTEEELVFPDGLKRNIQHRIDEYIATTWSQMRANNRIDLQFRTFLHWLDRELLSMFISGLRAQRLALSAQAAGISVAHVGKWRGKEEVRERRVTEPADTDGDKVATFEGTGDLVSLKLDELGLHSGSESAGDTESDKFDSDVDEQKRLNRETTSGGKAEVPISTSSGKTVEIELTHLELREQAASLRCTTLCIEFACTRCSTAVTLPLHCGTAKPTSTAKLTGVSKKCIRCRTDFAASFESSIAHGSSSLVGRLVGVTGITPNDILVGHCVLEVQCLSCGHNTAITEPHYGVNESRCMKCFAQLRISFDSSRFYSVTSDGRQLVARSNLRRVALSDSLTQPGRAERQKEASRSIGTPLPNFGTCKHYGKSFRWFRFSCCGKLYPCDECHREAEKSHEEQLASRMVCGFCSTEQPINAHAVCTRCLSDLRRGNSRSAHWEGGQGCRDVIRMARGDRKKFLNQNKTESRHAEHNRNQQRRQGKGPPKDTKLRHAAEQS